MLPTPVPLSLLGDVATALDVDRRLSLPVMESGLAGRTYRSEVGLQVESSRVEELARRPWVEPPHPAALVVRVGAAREADEDPERDYLGWHAALPKQARRDGVRGWWPVREPDRHIGGTLIVALATFIVDVVSIEGYETAAGGRRRFTVGAAAPEATTAFVGRRLRTRAGPLLGGLDAAP